LSKHFIKRGFNKSEIQKAATQEAQLSYFTESQLQEDRLDNTYLQEWAERKYQTNDYFLNWVKLIFKAENSLTFARYLRFPLPSAKLIHNNIEPQLRRVFNAEDSDFKYDVIGKELSDFKDDLQIKKFNEDIFNQTLYRHNSILIEDLDPVIQNMPKRFFVDIKDVLSIIPSESGIEKIAFKASIFRGEKLIDGSLFIDNKIYAFFDEDHNLVGEEIPHDLGRTPANFISPGKFKGSSIVRESIYTYVRPDLEEYVFLKTIQRMTEPNGPIPTISRIDTDADADASDDKKGSELEPSSDFMMGSQQAQVHSQNEGKGTGDLQPGTIHLINPQDIRNNDGLINMDVVTNWIAFHHMPIEPLDYLSTRIKEIEKSIKSTIIGDVVEGDEESKNKFQIEKSLSVLNNVLTSLAESFNRIRTKSDTNMLGLKYGPDKVNEVFIHYGTDFFLESQTQLFEDLQSAPNTLERKNIIVRINQNRHKNNIDQSFRNKILYDLIPYCSDKDFEIARDTQSVTDVNLPYQLQFNYWIGLFEERHGNIVIFWKESDGTNEQKLEAINKLIILIIKENVT
jgi:hypothetical protein